MKNFIELMPIDLLTEITGYEWSQIFGGLSSSDVFRLTKFSQPALFLKIAPISPVSGRKTLLPEKERLQWLHNRLPVPQVVGYASTDAQEYLLISEIAGKETCHADFATAIPQVVRELARGLRQIHALPIDDCPFDGSLDQMLAIAEAQFEQGLVDESAFDAHRQGQSAQSLWHELLARRPATEDLVLTHGDYCLPNILLHEQKLSGFIDMGLFGVSDRYRDLALATRSLILNWGEEWVSLLFQEYGLDPDAEMIDYYCLLDEFF